MGMLDWFKNRSSQFDADAERLTDELRLRAINKAVTLTNPRLKLLDNHQDCLAPVVETSIRYLRAIVRALPPPIAVAATDWAMQPDLRAFFVGAADIPLILGRSPNLRTLFNKFPQLETAHFILGMAFSEQRVFGMSMQGGLLQREVAQMAVSFSDHKVRICGHSEVEVRRLLGAQLFEYLLAQALSEIGDERSERRELEENRALIRARLRLLQQQGPGLGSVFTGAPESYAEQSALEVQLQENERQLEALGSPRAALEKELELLCAVLAAPERYLHIEQKKLCLNTMNVVIEEPAAELCSDVSFSLVELNGVQKIQRAFTLGTFSRGDLLPEKGAFEHAERYL
jgi:hypothetical protein